MARKKHHAGQWFKNVFSFRNHSLGGLYNEQSFPIFSQKTSFLCFPSHFSPHFYLSILCRSRFPRKSQNFCGGRASPCFPQITGGGVDELTTPPPSPSLKHGYKNPRNTLPLPPHRLRCSFAGRGRRCSRYSFLVRSRPACVWGMASTTWLAYIFGQEDKML